MGLLNTHRLSIVFLILFSFLFLLSIPGSVEESTSAYKRADVSYEAGAVLGDISQGILRGIFVQSDVDRGVQITEASSFEVMWVEASRSAEVSLSKVMWMEAVRVGEVEKCLTIAIFTNESFGQICVHNFRNDGCDIFVKCDPLVRRIICLPTYETIDGCLRTDASHG